MKLNNKTSIKSTTPLTLEMENMSGSEDSSEYINSPNSPNMKTTFLDSMDTNHDYACPEELRQQIDGMKKQNLLYEPLPPPPRSFYEKDEKHSTGSNDSRLLKFFLLGVFLLSLGAFILSVMTSFGFINNCSCSTGAKSSMRSSPYSSFEDPIDDALRIKWLQGNLTKLALEIVPSLHKQIESLKNTVTLMSNHTGPPGPIGPEGPPGPAGVADFSKCEHVKEAIATPFRSTVDQTFVQTMWTSGRKGYIIIGASCTTEGGSEYGLFTKTQQGKKMYQCRCAGKSITNMFQAPSLLCRINYWECPLST